MNKTLYLNGGLTFTVTGVFKDIPDNSHLKFDMLLSFPNEKFQVNNWSWNEFYTYVMLSPGTNSRVLENKFPAFIKQYLGSKTEQRNSKNSISLSKWLNNFAFHAPLNPFVLVITFTAVTIQSLKSALSNPLSSLRDE